MNLNSISITPHAEGFIKIACESDPALADRRRTKSEFLITARHHPPGTSAGLDGTAAGLAPHPITAELQQQGAENGEKVVREVPVRLFFDKADRAISIAYQAFSTDKLHVPVCAGNGRDAVRLTAAADNTATTQNMPCPGPELCDFVRSGQAVCHRQVRMPVQIKGQRNPFTVFEVRTTSLNSYRALKGQLRLIEKMFKGLRHVPLKLTLWQASNEASGYEPFDLMRLDLDAPSVIEAKQAADKERSEMAVAGLDFTFDEPAEEEASEIVLGVPTLDFQAMREVYEAPVQRRAAPDGSRQRGVASGFATTVLQRAFSMSATGQGAFNAASIAPVGPREAQDALP
jgi:hypothetical protein